MAAFDVDVNENNGRSGTFDFEDGRKFQTPDYVPSRADFNHLQHSKFLKQTDYENIQIGEYVCWLDGDQISSLIDDHQ